jgi:peptide/nickel transport system ATP-binding protein
MLEKGERRAMNEHLLELKDLQILNKEEDKSFLRKVNVKVNRGEIVSLIGESGSGKSLTARAIMGLLPSEMLIKGEILFNNDDLLKLSPAERRRFLGKDIGMIFQDFRGSFTPFIKIGKQMVETIRTHYNVSKKEARLISLEVLEKMGLVAEQVYRSYPFQLSGGQVQRVAIAMAISLKPSLLICDEITTALDVINGEKVLNYLDKVRKETDCAVLMITHDLALAYKRADYIYVMNQGEIVEGGLPEQIRCHHKHPYTKKLCSCLLSLPEKKNVIREGVSSR